ncbi:MAG: hypothetical protein OES46_12600 [Gammaproteobacteria bacterium]|jgi:aminoglycoside phosphotransferase family enzyme|nr:hypothetical protein [Gammaproteobacteria bacterium]
MASKALGNRRICVAPETKVAILQQAKTYPDRPSRVDVVETHMSWVFLTARYAYKMKKPVRYDFLDFSTVEARKNNCAEEVRLNRRLAHDLYIGVVPLTVDADGNIALDGSGEAIDWLVKMRRLPADCMLDYLIMHHAIRQTDIRSAALLLANFYKESPVIEIDAVQYKAQFKRDIDYNLRGLIRPTYGLDVALVKDIHDAQLKLLRNEATLFDRRIAEKRIIEAHGDLRPGHICLEPRPVIFDCLEFNRQFRILDPADELSFLAMECEHLGVTFVGREFFRIYEQVTQDRPPGPLVHFYKAYRACLRARLAIWHTHELEKSHWPKWRDLANAYLRLADRHSQQL